MPQKNGQRCFFYIRIFPQFYCIYPVIFSLWWFFKKSSNRILKTWTFGQATESSPWEDPTSPSRCDENTSQSLHRAWSKLGMAWGDSMGICRKMAEGYQNSWEKASELMAYKIIFQRICTFWEYIPISDTPIPFPTRNASSEKKGAQPWMISKPIMKRCQLFGFTRK